VNAAGLPYKDPKGIACPAAPAGWTIAPGDSTDTPPGGRTITQPSTVGGDGGAQGGTEIDVACQYSDAASGGILRMDVRYALPSDPAPGNDFYFGCSSSGVAWSDSLRTYHVMSPTQWAVASFSDTARQLKTADVPAFEGVAKKLLSNADGFGHACSTAAGQTATLFSYQLSFAGPAGNGKVAFQTSAALISSGSLPVVSTTTPQYKLRLPKGPVTVKVTSGVKYYPAVSTQKPRLELNVKLVKSALPGCVGATKGTLVLTESTLQLKACGKSFDGGKTTGKVTVT
jgi:hypothetical protein